MKRQIIITTLLALVCVAGQAQEVPEAFRPLMNRLTAFGKAIPQEKVYVHMDNTCYFQGDTIWFTAYTRQTNTDQPSEVSGVLYVELLNQDGYLVERKLIEMKEGRGSGFFDLNNLIQYSVSLPRRKQACSISRPPLHPRRLCISSRVLSSRLLRADSS